MRLIERWAARRGEPLCPFEADVGLGRLHRLPIRRRFDAVRFEVDVDEVLTQIAGHVEQLLDGALSIFVVAFAEVVQANGAVAIDDVQGGPIPVREGVPDRVVAVDGDGICQLPLLDCPLMLSTSVSNGNSGV